MVLNNHYKLLQKKLEKLKKNPLNNNKFLQIAFKYSKTKTVYERIDGRLVKKEIIVDIYHDVPKERREKWKIFSNRLAKANSFFRKFRPYSFNHYNVEKFASLGTSYKKTFRKNLFIKKFFNYYYGGFKNRFLKNQMSSIFMSKQVKNLRVLCIEIFECRLDAVLKKAKFSPSIKGARQLISHRHVKLNGAVESNYSRKLGQGDLIQIQNSKPRRLIQTHIYNLYKERYDKVLWPAVPTYLSINYLTLEIILGSFDNFNFSPVFPFKNDNARLVEACFRD